MSALDRFGGVFLHPRRTLAAILDGRGSFFEILPWMILAAIIVAPTQAGQVVLVGRTSPVDGVRAFFGLISTRAGGPLLGAVAGALLLVGWARHRGRALGFDRAFDACAYALLPHFALAALGAMLSALGAELWFMPHRLLRGTGWYLAARFAVAYGWSLLLFLTMLRTLREARDEG